MRFVIPFRFRRSALYSLASRFILDLTTELVVSFLTPAVYVFDIALETAHSVKFQGFGLHLRRRADLSLAVPISSSSFISFSFNSPSCIECLFVSTSSLRIKSPAPGSVESNATVARYFSVCFSLSPDRKDDNPSLLCRQFVSRTRGLSPCLPSFHFPAVLFAFP